MQVLQDQLRDEKHRWYDKEVLTAAVAGFYNTIGTDDILREVNGKWMVGEKEVDDSIKQAMIGEAKTLLNMRLWKVLQNDIKYRANKQMFLESQSEIDLIAGKLWLYTLDCINTRLDSISKESGRFNK